MSAPAILPQKESSPSTCGEDSFQTQAAEGNAAAAIGDAETDQAGGEGWLEMVLRSPPQGETEFVVARNDGNRNLQPRRLVLSISRGPGRRHLKVVLLSSAPLLMRSGLLESLAGRFEVIHLPHWSLSEMRQAFGWSLEQYLFYGGYPGAAPLVKEPERWARYVKDSLIETTISRDVLLLTRVDKPAVLRRLFDLGCAYSGQVHSYTKMLGRLTDAGNATTLAHYLDLLSAAGMLTGLQKFAGSAVRRRGSIPKLQVLNTALMTAQSGLSFPEARADRGWWGRLVESAVGAHLANAAAGGACEVYYWRDRNREVDFVVRAGRAVTAIEVKSGRARDTLAGMQAFAEPFKPKRKLLVGGGGIAIDEFLSKPVEHWVR